VDAAKEGFKTWVVEEGVRSVDPGEWEKVKEGFKAAGVTVVSFEGEEVKRVGKL
jgi:hypothetical protein